MALVPRGLAGWIGMAYVHVASHGHCAHPKRARITGVFHTFWAIALCLDIAEAILIRRHAPFNVQVICSLWHGPTLSRYWMSNLGVLTIDNWFGRNVQWSMMGKKSLERCSLPVRQESNMPREDTVQFTVQGLRDVLTAMESTVTEQPHPMDEYIIQLEVMMVDQPGQLHPPTFSGNAGMVLHVLKNDLALRELEHIQVDGPGTAYLFFYDRHGCHSLTKEAALAICSHLADGFVEWIGWSAHFKAVLLLLDEGHHHETAAHDRCQQHIQTQDQPNLPVASCPPKVRLMRGRGGGFTPFLTRTPWQSRFRWLQLPLSKLEAEGIIDTGEWRGDWHQPGWIYQCSSPWMPMQMWPMSFGTSMSKDCWISMMRWACAPTFLVISKDDLLRCMDHTFRNVRDYDSMIWSLY